MRKAKHRLVAVEETLTPVAEALRDTGYDVCKPDEEDLSRVDAVVVSGQEDNLMDIQSVETTVPVISAEGKTADEVVEELEESLEDLGY